MPREKLADPPSKPRSPLHLVEQLTISLDKAKTALNECCTDGTAHAALALALFEQTISKLDETRYMVRRSKEQATREEGRQVSNARSIAVENGTDGVRTELDVRGSDHSAPHDLRRAKKADLALSKNDTPPLENHLASPFNDILGSNEPPALYQHPELLDRDRYGRDVRPTARPTSALSTHTSSSRHAAAPKGSETFSGIPQTLSPQSLELSDHFSRSKGGLRSVDAAPSEPSPDWTAKGDRGRAHARSDRASRPKDFAREFAAELPGAGSRKPAGRSSSRARSRASSISSSISSGTDIEEEGAHPPRSRRPSVANSRRGSVTSRRGGNEGRTTLSSSRKLFELASAPPDSEGEADHHSDTNPRIHFSAARRSQVDGSRIARSLVAAIAVWPLEEAISLLRTLALVGPAYREAAQAELFRHVTISNSDQLRRCVSVLTGNATLASAVLDLTLNPREADAKSRHKVLQDARALLRCAPNLRGLDEELFKGDFDITDLDQDYLLSSTSTVRLRSFRSRAAWWEISAIHALLTIQSDLEVLEVNGAVVDREWAGARLLEEPTKPSSRLRQLHVSQILHEDTLAVLFRACGGPTGRLEDVALGFQSIDRDTPRASITSAFKSVRGTVRKLTVTAPVEATEELSGFLDELVAELPALEVLEWNEGAGSLRIPMASSKFLDHLPPTLRDLRAHSLVSLSTSKILAWLESDELGPNLKRIDLDWATGRGDEEGREPWYRERHISRIQDAAQQVELKCKLSKGGAVN